MAIVNGTNGDDTINVGPGGATNGSDVIRGGAGNDVVNAGGGSDVVFGGAGNDRINGGGGDDEIYGGAGSDDLNGGGGDDVIEGGAGNDQLSGGNGDDVLDGGAGADVLVGGRGDDEFTGGAGDDRFVITGGGDDVVTDFRLNRDVMDFADAGGDINNITFTAVDNNTVIATGPGIPGGSVTINGPGVGTPAGINYLINSSAVCFYPGTLVATPDGERAIETLSIGDMVLTHDGRSLPVRWLGKQTVSRVFGDSLRILPIRIKAGALGENVPVRDLLVSPNHAILVEDTLVHAGALVNGTTITRERNVPMVFSYYNVELPEHTVILAEGARAETFVDNVERENFDNWNEHERLYGSLPSLVEMSLPRARSHRQVPASVRRLIAKRAEDLGMTHAEVA